MIPKLFRNLALWMITAGSLAVVSSIALRPWDDCGSRLTVLTSRGATEMCADSMESRFAPGGLFGNDEGARGFAQGLRGARRMAELRQGAGALLLLVGLNLIAFGVLGLCSGPTTKSKSSSQSGRTSRPEGEPRPLGIHRERARAGDLDYFRSLVAREPDVLQRTCYYEGSLVYMSVVYQQEELTQFFIDSGAELDAREGPINNPLGVAVGKGYNRTATALIEGGANVNNQFNKMAMAPLHIAAFSDNVEAVKLLLQVDADPSLRDRDDNQPVSYAKSTQVRRMLTAGSVHQAARSGDLTAIRALVDAGVDVSQPDRQGFPPIHRAAQFGHARLVELLVEVGVDVNCRGAQNSTAMHWAAAFGSAAVARILASAGAEVDIPDERGWTPLFLAINNHRIEVALLLLAMEARRSITVDNRALKVPPDLVLGCVLVDESKGLHFFNSSSSTSEEVTSRLLKQIQFDHESGGDWLVSYHPGDIAHISCPAHAAAANVVGMIIPGPRGLNVTRLVHEVSRLRDEYGNNNNSIQREMDLLTREGYAIVSTSESWVASALGSAPAPIP